MPCTQVEYVSLNINCILVYWYVYMYKYAGSAYSYCDITLETNGIGGRHLSRDSYRQKHIISCLSQEESLKVLGYHFIDT